MKAIFIAAGEGSRMGELTKHTPKSLIKVNEKSILERQITLLRKFNINDISIIIGPFSEKYKFDNVEYIQDVNYKHHDQLGSLIAGVEKIQNDVLVIFGDIIFDESILLQILKNNSEITIAVDMDWKKYELRNNNPIEDADKVAIFEDSVKRIFKDMKYKNEGFDIGEFIGLMKLNLNGSKKFREILLNLQKSHNGKFHDAESFTSAKLVDFLQELIEHKIIIHPEIIHGKWCEIDTIQDLEIARKMFKE